MFVGEQPGDQEDQTGEPFVGPAGALLDKALEDAGIPRGSVYVTNAVKHFSWEPRGCPSASSPPFIHRRCREHPTRRDGAPPTRCSCAI
jgi:uracil-DNA glycosylase family 4